MSSAITDDIAEIKQEIVAEEAADPTRKRLGPLFWICVGWIVLVAVLATIANLLPLPNPNLGNYNSVQNAGPGGGTSSAPTTSTVTSSAVSSTGPGSRSWWASGAR